MSGTIIIKDENDVVITCTLTDSLVINPNQYLTFDEILKSIFNELIVSDLILIKSMDKDDLITLHSGLGMWIRNQYGLWHEDNPLTHDGLYDDNKHPDNLSFKMIEDTWERLQRTNEIKLNVQSQPLVI